MASGGNTKVLLPTNTNALMTDGKIRDKVIPSPAFRFKQISFLIT